MLTEATGDKDICALIFMKGDEIAGIVPTKAYGLKEDVILTHLYDKTTYANTSYDLDRQDKMLVGFRWREKQEGRQHKYNSFEPVFWSIFDFCREPVD